jgi:putative spermidine/putrescine transport system substrate-binding protein
MRKGSAMITRRKARLLSILSVGAIALTACGAPGSPSDGGASTSVQPTKPSSPVSLTILDGAGDLVGSKPIIEQFVKDHPDLVSGVNYQTASAPDVAGKIKTQQSAGSVDISLVLGGPDILGAGEALGLFVQQLPAYASSLPSLNSIQDKQMQSFQALANGYGVLVRYEQSGPILAHAPSLADVPASPQELLDWAKANPGKFAYAQPPNSGPGRSFLQSLPYMLGDKDPSDPTKGWDKTWAYLDELGKYIHSYPASSTILNQQFGVGELKLIPTIIGMDINNRKNGGWPADSEVSTFADQNWITDGHFSMIPKGVSPKVLYVVLALEKSIVDAKNQAGTLNTGALTTANKNATVAAAGADVKSFLDKWGRPDFYPAALKRGTIHAPLTSEKLQEAFDLWQRKVGSKAGG